MSGRRRFEVGMWAIGLVGAAVVLSACYPVWAEGDVPTALRVGMSVLLVAAASLMLWVSHALIQHARAADSLPAALREKYGPR